MILDLERLDSKLLLVLVLPGSGLSPSVAARLAPTIGAQREGLLVWYNLGPVHVFVSSSVPGVGNGRKVEET